MVDYDSMLNLRTHKLKCNDRKNKNGFLGTDYHEMQEKFGENGNVYMSIHLS